MKFNEKLRELREQNSLTQQQLANKLCVSKMTVSHWENADAEPSIATLIAISEIFEVTLDELIKGKD